jgi:DNA-binding XRE family transcriptional regulator
VKVSKIHPDAGTLMTANRLETKPDEARPPDLNTLAIRRFGQNFRRLRRERKLTQKAFASAVGVSPGTVSRWEKGETQPPFCVLIYAARLFEVTLDELIVGGKLTPATVRLPSLEETLDI